MTILSYDAIMESIPSHASLRFNDTMPSLPRSKLVTYAKHLVNRGADLATPDRHGFTPMHALCVAGLHELISFYFGRDTFSLPATSTAPTPASPTPSAGPFTPEMWTNTIQESQKKLQGLRDKQGYTPLLALCATARERSASYLCAPREDPASFGGIGDAGTTFQHRGFVVSFDDSSTALSMELIASLYALGPLKYFYTLPVNDERTSDSGHIYLDFLDGHVPCTLRDIVFELFSPFFLKTFPISLCSVFDEPQEHPQSL
jgi:hypothetical protein